MYKRFVFLIFFSSVYKVCNYNKYNIYVLKDSCNLKDNRGVGRPLVRDRELCIRIYVVMSLQNLQSVSHNIT